ncbi:hypothetical protein GCM10023116_19630 [Kistimonas scapharcae]|uniref:Uncharacterized protein n=1 Tax=Kistimonas scapharcae TaxID=1036133 RepID=A0ABP8V293_9GAMM
MKSPYVPVFEYLPIFLPADLARAGFYLKGDGVLGCNGCSYEVKERFWERFCAITSLCDRQGSADTSILTIDHDKYLSFAQESCRFKASEQHRFSFRQYEPGCGEVVNSLVAYQAVNRSRGANVPTMISSRYVERFVFTDRDNISRDETELVYTVSGYEEIAEKYKKALDTIPEPGDYAELINEKITFLDHIAPHMKTVLMVGEECQRMLDVSCELTVDKQNNMRDAFVQLTSAMGQYSDGNSGFSFLISLSKNDAVLGAGETSGQYGVSGTLSETEHAIVEAANNFMAEMNSIIVEYATFCNLMEDSDQYNKVFLSFSPAELKQQVNKQREALAERKRKSTTPDPTADGEPSPKRSA